MADLSRSPRSVVLLGLVALAIAMGIGRFAFTPLMPLMLRDGTLDAVTGTEWAAANYIGYLTGALSASCFRWDPRRGVKVGLVGVTLATLAIAWGDASSPWIGAMLRAGAGVFSAWVLICTSSWALLELARGAANSLAGWMYTGVGLGVAIAGSMAWLGGCQPAFALWLELGVLAATGTTYVLRGLATPAAGPASPAPGFVPKRTPLPPSGDGHLGIVLCYSAWGFGYIIPATFLPTMARQLVSDPLIFGLTWPIFGLAAVFSVAFASRWLHAWPRRKVWALAQFAMGLGTLLPLLQQTLWVLVASAVLVGGTFMVITMAGLQLARERMPTNPTPLVARMTAGFATGQIAGPVFVRLIGSAETGGWDALAWANAAATVLLVASALWLWRTKAGDGLR